MKKIAVFLLSAMLLVGLAGCTTTGGSKEATGTGVGAASGALLGGIIANNSGSNPLVGALIGAAIGAAIGNRIGAALDEQERQALAAATERAMRARPNQRIAWTAPPPSKSSSKRAARTSSSSKQSTSKKGSTATAQAQAKPAHGYVVSGETYTKSDGQQCRNITQVAYKNGQEYKDSVTRCGNANAV